MNTDKIYAEAIANEYSVKNASKVVALKKLDRKAKTPANIAAYSIGVISSLILGVGMCLSMEVIEAGSAFTMVWVIILGIIGIAGVSVNYLIYKKLLKSGKEKYWSLIFQRSNGTRSRHQQAF